MKWHFHMMIFREWLRTNFCKRGTGIWSFLDKRDHYSGPWCCKMVKFWLGGAFFTIFQGSPTCWPSDLYRGQSSKEAFLAPYKTQTEVWDWGTFQIKWIFKYSTILTNEANFIITPEITEQTIDLCHSIVPIDHHTVFSRVWVTWLSFLQLV